MPPWREQLKSNQLPSGENSGPSSQFISQGVIWRASSGEPDESRLWTNTAEWSSSKRVRSKTSLFPSGENAGPKSSNSNAPRFWTLVTWWGLLPSSPTMKIPSTMELSSSEPVMRRKAIDLPSGEKAGSESWGQQLSGLQCVTLRVSPVLTSTTMIRFSLQWKRLHRRWKATVVPSGDHTGELSLKPSGGWVIWRMWLPLGYIVKMALLECRRPSRDSSSPK